MDSSGHARTARVVAGDRLTRRRLLGAGGAAIAVAGVARLHPQAAAARGFAATPTPAGAGRGGGAIPISGRAVPELAAFDAAMAGLVTRWDVPGGQLAVSKDGRLVFDRAYGFADVEAGEPFRPASLCRIASNSKPITTVAILSLVDDGRLSLDDRAFRLLATLPPPEGAPIDPRLDAITIEHLLVHAGGWDSSSSYDPQEQPWTWREAGVLGVPAPPSAEQIVRAMLGEPLDFDPGTRSVYSNFGFNVLGRVIEQVSGRPYEAFVRERVLAPAGVARMRIGGTRLEERAPDEVRYYGPPGVPPFPSVFPGEGYAPLAYGGFYLPSFDAHGGWIASAADMLRFATAIDGQRGPALLRPATVEAMLRTPRPAASAGASGAGNAEAGMGLGWVVVPAGGGLDWSHTGALIGSTASWITRTHDGLGIVVIFNTQPADALGFFRAFISTIQQTAAAVSTWPAHDLFATGG